MIKNMRQRKSPFDGLEGVSGAIKVMPTIQERQFSPYDETTGTKQTPYGYAGEMEDGNNLVYLRARYYNRATGTFLSLDPYTGNFSNPASLNRYTYAYNNPINNTDPSGMMVCSNSTSLVDQLLCLAKVYNLYKNFGITLAEESTTDPEARNNWTSPRVNKVYEAVQAINGRLGGLTQQAIGDTELVLVPENTKDTAAATTSLCNKITLFMKFPDIDGVTWTNWVHNADNLIHEFGHVITLSPPVGRTANSEAVGPSAEMANRPVTLWQQIRTYLGFTEGEGWVTPEILRQNTSSAAYEVVPDMFLYWVRGYEFTQDTIGQARSTFMNGGNIPDLDGNPLRRVNDGSVIQSAGIMAWAGKASCPGSTRGNISDSSLANDPYLLAANNGWCSFT